jgi:hypothetical protein
VVLAAIFLAVIAGYVQKWLWMRQLGYAGIFWTLLSIKWAMFCSAFAFAFLYLWINLRRAASKRAAGRQPVDDDSAIRVDALQPATKSPRQPQWRAQL